MRKILRWDDVYSEEETNVFAREISSLLLSRIRDSEARGYLQHCIDCNDFLALCDYSIDYTVLTVSDAISIRQILALFQKRRDQGCDVAREINALSTFREAEQLCAESNHIFRRWSRGGFQFTPAVESVLFRAQRKISRVLGDVPLLSDLKVRFGPGSTTTVPKRMAAARFKLAAPFACSGDLSAFVSECLEELPAWINFSDAESTQVTVEIHPGRLVFVPKDRKTFRAIGPEPMLNGMFQLGIGSYMARRLKRFGVDITDQSRNQKLARIGSIEGGLATLDLSSASDCISIGLVEHLLPHDWSSFLGRFRTGLLEYSDSVIKLEKFSTMGNGYTFPLETLIFWALAQGVCESKEECDTVSVYGDDIIVPTHRYELLVEVLTACGFKVNTKKSFASGPFRESCGADYLSGINIRPYYLRDSLSGESAFSFYNFCKREYDTELCDIILSYLDPTMILWGPDGYGDGHLISEDQNVLVAHQYHGINNRGYGGYTFETYTKKNRRLFRGLLPGDRVLPSYSIYVKESPYVDGFGVAFEHRDFSAGVIRLLPHEFLHSEDSGGADPVTYRKGKLGTTVPGSQGYKRIKIYVFA